MNFKAFLKQSTALKSLAGLWLCLSCNAFAQELHAPTGLTARAAVTNASVVVTTNSVIMDPKKVPQSTEAAPVSPTQEFLYGNADLMTLLSNNGSLISDAYLASSDRVLMSLKGRLGGENPSLAPIKPLEFHGKSTAGHEFKILIRGRGYGYFPAKAFPDDRDYMLDVAIYFEGAGPHPILGRLYRDISIDNKSGVSFRGALISQLDEGTHTFTVDKNSEIKLAIDLNEATKNFELKSFTLKAGADTSTPLPDKNETIVFGGLDSGGGK